jgi:hypothetical protein
VTLVERCERLQERIAWSSDLHARKAKAEGLADRTSRVSSLRPRVEGAVMRAKAIREHGLPATLPPCHLAVVACRDAAAALRENAGAGMPGELGDEAWKRLTVAIDEDAKAFELAVRVAIDAAQKPVRDLQLAGFEAVAIAFGKEPQVAQIKMERQSLLAESWYGKTAAELRRILERSARLLETAAELRDTDAPEEVKRFLDRARRAEATFAELTTDVRNWLEQKGLVGQLRISLGAR